MSNIFKSEGLDWTKGGGLLPCIVQSLESREVLMLGYMNQEALALTLETGFVTFFSRSRQKIWQKGEQSGALLELCKIQSDCDGDTILVTAKPHGPTCHEGTASCFRGGLSPRRWELEFLNLWQVIDERGNLSELDRESYTHKLLSSPVGRVAQKVGEEGVEVAISAVTGEGLAEEAADLVYHLFVLLKKCNLTPDDVTQVLANRRAKKKLKVPSVQSLEFREI